MLGPSAKTFFPHRAVHPEGGWFGFLMCGVGFRTEAASPLEALHGALLHHSHHILWDQASLKASQIQGRDIRLLLLWGKVQITCGDIRSTTVSQDFICISLLGLCLGPFGCYDKILQTGWLVNNRHLFLTVRGLGKSKIVKLADFVSAKNPYR